MIATTQKLKMVSFGALKSILTAAPQLFALPLQESIKNFTNKLHEQWQKIFSKA